jgi:hypothetical protein
LITNQTPQEWAMANFSGAELSHRKRLDRAVTIAEAMAASPGRTLPQMFANHYDLKATYEFFRHPEVTPDNLQGGHREVVLMEMEKPGRYLLIEDTSEIYCSENLEIEGLGPIGSSKERKIGFHLHSLLAVRWPKKQKAQTTQRPIVEILGLADQQFYVRRPRPENNKPQSSLRRSLPADELESVLWERASTRLGMAPEDEDVIWIKVCDRGADIFDHMSACRKQNHRFVIRATVNRALVNSQGKRAGTLFETVRQSPSLGKVSIKLRARPGKPARTAQLEISLAKVMLRSPQTMGHAPGSQEPIACTAVRIWEPNPPEGIEALEWILLTDLPVENFEQACEIAQIYSTRWLEEEFHKALKTGMGAERLQLTTAHGWFAAIAMMSIAALRLIEIREVLREMPEAPAEAAGLSPLELQVLQVRTDRSLSTVRDVALAIGRLGGHLNRKGDGMPGLITLWRGRRELETLVEGVLIARKLTNSG